MSTICHTLRALQTSAERTGLKLHSLFRQPLFWVALTLFFLIGIGEPGKADEPSFDCSKASQPIEHLICKSDELSALDAELADALIQRLDASNEGRMEILAGQRQWLHDRTAACPLSGKIPAGRETEASERCVAKVYETRISALQAGISTGNTALACDAKLSDTELSRFKALITGRVGVPDFDDFVKGDGSVFFACRDRRHEPDNFIFRPSEICTACGQIYSVHQENGKDALSESRVGGNTEGSGELVYDAGGHPFVMVAGDYAAHGVEGVSYELISLDNGIATPLVSTSSSMEDECAAPGLAMEETMNPPKKAIRKDGHYDIVFRITQTSCETRKTSTRVVRFVSTESGFKKQ